MGKRHKEAQKTTREPIGAATWWTCGGRDSGPNRCKRLATVGGKEPIKALFTFKGNHRDLSLQIGPPPLNDWARGRAAPLCQRSRLPAHMNLNLPAQSPGSGSNHGEETIRTVLNVCGRKWGGGDRGPQTRSRQKRGKRFSLMFSLRLRTRNKKQHKKKRGLGEALGGSCGLHLGRKPGHGAAAGPRLAASSAKCS